MNMHTCTVTCTHTVPGTQFGERGLICTHTDLGTQFGERGRA